MTLRSVARVTSRPSVRAPVHVRDSRAVFDTGREKAGYYHVIMCYISTVTESDEMSEHRRDGVHCEAISCSATFSTAQISLRLAG